jgi:ABC-type glycerol-3-phosphate transport system permease component
LLPVYILLVTSLKSYAEVNLSTMWSLPKGISLDSFLRAWNGDPSKGTIGLSSNFMNSLKWNVQMAGAILAALPTLVIFIILGRYFLRGLLAGSLKG